LRLAHVALATPRSPRLAMNRNRHGRGRGGLWDRFKYRRSHREVQSGNAAIETTRERFVPLTISSLLCTCAMGRKPAIYQVDRTGCGNRYYR